MEDDKKIFEKIVNYMIEHNRINKKNRIYYIQAVNLIYNNRSLEQLMETGDDISSNIRVDSDFNLEKDRFMSLLKKLSPCQYEFINLFYGFNGEDVHNLNQIATMKNVSLENVRYYKKAGIKQILRS